MSVNVYSFQADYQGRAISHGSGLKVEIRKVLPHDVEVSQISVVQSHADVPDAGDVYRRIRSTSLAFDGGSILPSP